MPANVVAGPSAPAGSDTEDCALGDCALGDCALGDDVAGCEGDGGGSGCCLLEGPLEGTMLLRTACSKA